MTSFDSFTQDGATATLNSEDFVNISSTSIESRLLDIGLLNHQPSISTTLNLRSYDDPRNRNSSIDKPIYFPSEPRICTRCLEGDIDHITHTLGRYSSLGPNGSSYCIRRSKFNFSISPASFEEFEIALGMSAPQDLDSLAKAGSNQLGNSFLVDPNRPEIPHWFDKQRFDSGREFFRRHALSIIFGYFCALYAGLTVESLSNAVSFTGESNTADRSRRRYLNTLGHIYCWHTCDVISDQSSDGYRSVRYIRSWHDRVRKQMRSASTNGHEIKNFITQYETAVVQVGFIAHIVLYPRFFGIRCDEVELSNYIYFWRVIGYILGLDDDVNACAGDLRNIRTIAKEIEQGIVVPGLRNPTPAFLILSESLVEGFKRIEPWINSRIIRGFIFPLLGLPTPNDLTWKDWFILILLKIHFTLMYQVPWYSSYFNEKIFRMAKRSVPSVIP